MLNQIKGMGELNQTNLFPKILNTPKSQAVDKANDQVIKNESIIKKENKDSLGIIGKVCGLGGAIAGGLSGISLLGLVISSACLSSPLISGIAGFFSGGIIGGGGATFALALSKNIKNIKITNNIRLLLFSGAAIGGELAGVILGASGVIPSKIMGNVIGGILGSLGGLWSGSLIGAFIEKFKKSDL